MADLSSLDKKYFVDDYKYNCPFCKRGSVSYSVVGKSSFDWSNDKKCYLYIVKCESCDKRSLHLSEYSFYINPEIDRFSFIEGIKDGSDKDWEKRIDEFMFYSQPTSFFTLDERIPREVRELITEADNCLKMNLLVGASAALRKSIYELIRKEGAAVKNEKTGLTDYKDSIKNLKEGFLRVQGDLFDALGSVQEMASDIIHEASWDKWDSQKLRALIELTSAVVHEMYVIPDEQKKRAGVISEIKSLFSGDKISES